MVSSNNNGAVLMDATFGILDMKFHLFMLMVFDAHHTKMLVTWIIISHQTCNGLGGVIASFELAKPQNNMHWWKPSCFIIHDDSQDLRTLWRVLFSSYPFLNSSLCI
jgi:hypothetical protein